MKRPIALCLGFIAILAGVLVSPRTTHAQMKEPMEKTRTEAGNTENVSQTTREPSEAETDCIVRMLRASTLAQAKARKAVCKDSFVLRAYYASLLVKLHAPGADEEIVRNMPKNLSDLHSFSDAADIFYGRSYANYSGMLILSHGYDRYYKSLFRIVAERPSLLPRFFPIADRFGAPVGDNVYEEGLFCNALHDIEVKIPAAYWRAVRQAKNKEYRDLARGCALHPVP